MKVGVLGAGTMGAGIAQVAAQAEHEVVLVDVNADAVEKAKSSLIKLSQKQIEKGKWTEDYSNQLISRIQYSTNMQDFSGVGIVIEAIVENVEVKHKVFSQLESIVGNDCILASNTSSIPIAEIGSVLKNPTRMIGIHFFNPAPLMPLVEIIPAVQTNETIKNTAKALIDSWGKITVLAKDTPGFIVNRVARSFYGEALRIYEEGIADFATIDWAMTHFGGFRMGPFTLMDYIGNDVNYAVTESVYHAFYNEPRFKPSFTQKRHAQAGYLGRKSGRGYYDYSEGVEMPQPNQDEQLGKEIFNRILVMLINEAADTLFWGIASKEDIDLAMMKGVNYPKGLLQWGDEIGLDHVLQRLENLFEEYGEDRYRPSPMLKRMVKEGKKFF
ncbi:MAG: 3-hydroxybutyryl-CoA dehydrogenase [Brumimicrobium sp.]|nr:3-hydroxybutyryl-CoA dehydrogenase [Brumimicrobium sp.]